MRYLRVPLALLLLCVFAGMKQAGAQEITPVLEIQGNGDAEGSFISTNLLVFTNGVVVKYTDAAGLAVLEADQASVNNTTGDVFAEGNVRIQKAAQTWAGPKLHYNLRTGVLDTQPFRVGQPPFYLAGDGVSGVGKGTNEMYEGTNAFITTDNESQPLQKVRAKRFVIVPGEYVEAHDATLCVGDVPIFYFPYYHRKLKHDPNEFNFVPGYRSLFGPYLLSSYDWVWDDQLRGAFHMDYRESRGWGAGPDFNYNYGSLGEGTLRYYYTYDHKPGTDPITSNSLPNERQRLYFNYNAHPATNLTIMSQVGYQTDPYIVRDFFESQYNKDIQPNTFVDANQYWKNWSVDALAQTRVNRYWESVERLPEARLSGFKQQIFDLPVFYESESTAGYYRREFSNTNGLNPTNFAPPDFEGGRVDTFHQLTMPETFFGWLNFTPRVGERYTYYTRTYGAGSSNPTGNPPPPGSAAFPGPGPVNPSSYVNTPHNRTVFETGAELSFTASRVWRDVDDKFWDLDGLRHIFQPSLDYVYIPQPSVLPGQLPQYDYSLTNNLRLLPLEFPENNAIDSINRENTIRYGVNNRLQTKRNGEIDDVVNWGVYVDWHLHPRTDQTTFSDIYSDLSLKPRSWITFQSFTRYSIYQGQFNLAEHSITLQPNTTWNWTVSHLYLRQGPIFGAGEDLFSSVLFYRFNENWGFRTAHYFDATSGTLQEQDYTIYRDLRSWTAALTFRALDNQSNGKDYGVAFTFSFKSFPRFALGADTVRSAALVGY